VGDINASDVSCNALTSNGIDDNATSNAITINSSEQVGIGVTPSTTYSQKLQVSNGIRLSSSGADYAAGPTGGFFGGYQDASIGLLTRIYSYDTFLKSYAGTHNEGDASSGDVVIASRNVTAGQFPDFTSQTGTSGDVLIHTGSVLAYSGTYNIGKVIIQGELGKGIEVNRDGDTTSKGKLTITNANYDNHLELNRSSEQWRFSPSTDGSLDIRRVSGTGDAIVDLPKTIVTDSLGATTISGAGFSTDRSIAYIGTASAGQQLRFQSDVVTVYDQG